MFRKTLPILFILFSTLLKAGNPVTVIVSLTPPYTPFLNEYSSSDINKLQVTLIVNDARMQNYPVKLQMFIESPGGTVLMHTNPYAVIPPILLQGQTSEILEGSDLALYFLAQNNTFSGFDQGQYIQTGRIPDGQYKLGFRVVDSRRTDVILSNTAYSAPGWFVLNEPPLLNLPRNTDIERINDPQNLKLEWFPRHLGSMNSAFATKYKIELFPIRVPGMNPEQVALSSLPAYTEVINQPRIYLTNSQYMLEQGVQYAWRVKAYAEEGLTVFNNNGYSEVFSFTYGSACPSPEQPEAINIEPRKATITWETDPMQTSFKVQYRLRSAENTDWHFIECFQNYATISNMLTPGTTYEYQVSAKCNMGISENTLIKTFTTTRPLESFSCGAKDSALITNHNPKAFLNVGDFIYNGNFPVKLTEVSGGNGVFTGKGRMRIPMLNNAQVNMQFTSIKVNELSQVYEGELISIYDVKSKFLIDVPALKDILPIPSQRNTDFINKVDTTLSIDGTIIKVVTQGDQTIITTSTGETITINNNKVAEIHDSKGNVYTAAGGAMVAVSLGSSSSSTSDNKAVNQNSIIQFRASNEQKFGFDAGNVPLANNEQSSLGGTPYSIAWKSVEIGKYDKVDVITKSDTGLKGVVFRTEDGAVQMYTNQNLQISSALTQKLDALKLVKDTGNKAQQVITGQLNIVAYPSRTVRVTIVPVNGNQFPDNTNAAQDSIKKAFAQAAVSAEVTFADNFQVPEIDFTNPFDDDVCAICDYTSPMRTIWDAYKKVNNGGISDMYYIFLVKNSKTGKTGYFPFGEQYGFVYADGVKGKGAKSLAHELGHGAFKLEHYPQHPPTGNTNNLMDYGNGYSLIKSQWDCIHDPGGVLLFTDAKEASMQSIEGFLVKNLFDDIICAKKNDESIITVTNYSKLTQQKPGVFWSSNFPNNIYMGEFEVSLVYASSNSKDILDISIVKVQDNIITIGDDYNCRLIVTIRRKLISSPDDALLLYNFLRNSFDQIDDKIKQKITSLDALKGESFAKSLAQIPECYYPTFSYSQRAEYINKLSPFYGTYLYLIQKLISTCPPIDREIQSFFKDLITKIEFKKILLNPAGWVTRDHYNTLNREMVSLFYKQSKNMIEIIPENTFIWNKGGLDLMNYISIYDNSGMIVFKTTNEHLLDQGGSIYTPYPDKVLDPFININVDFRTSLNYVGVNGILPMPAFMFHWIINEYNERQLKTAIDISLFVASFSFTFAELTQAKKTYKIIIGIIELVHSSGELIFTLEPGTRDYFGRTPSGLKFLKWWDTAKDILDIKDITESAIDKNFPVFLSLQEAWDEVKSENSDIGSQIANDYKKIDDIIKITR